MKTPFVYGRLATGDNFTDRQEETTHLVNNFRSSINTMIISPRRWGKSSLVHKAAKVAMEMDKDVRVCHIDLFNVRNESEFFTLLASSVLKATSTKWEDVVEVAKRFLSKVLPKVVFGAEPDSEISIELDWSRAKENIDEILDLPEKIAQERGLKVVICIDEFQNIANFSDPDYFQRRLRSHWQLHQGVAYCLYGSKRHMLMEVFADASKPLYKFGDLMFLDKVPQKYMAEFIDERFRSTGKAIEPQAVDRLLELTDNHPYYSQQLAQIAWLRTQATCDIATVEDSHQALIEQLSLLFSNIAEGLTNQQINLLHAIVEQAQGLTTSATLRRYHFSSATAMYRCRETLVKRDIIDVTAGAIQFQDPMFAYWLRHIYFTR
ncbi:MAG: ATPase [Bacteroidales bacterium]|nr:ATPase [Bacteroidales bacterium]